MMILRSRRGGTYMLTIKSKQVYTYMMQRARGHWETKRFPDGNIFTCFVFDDSITMSRDEIEIVIEPGDYLQPHR